MLYTKSSTARTLKMAFQKHGLIRTPLQQVLYFEAHWANISTGIANPKEDKTIALIEAIFNQNVFSGPTFSSASQYPPAPNSRNKIDDAILYLDSGTASIMCLNLSESKRASSRSGYSLASLERQALDYCTEYLQSKPLSSIYLCDNICRCPRPSVESNARLTSTGGFLGLKTERWTERKLD